MSKLTVYKDNRVIESGYRLNKIEQNIILYAVSKINPLEKYLDVEIDVNEFAELFNLNANSVYNQLKKAIDDLYDRSIKIKSPIEEEEFRWIYSKKYFSNEGRLTLSFTPQIAPYLTNLKDKFTRYKLINVSKFKREYSFRFYELLAQYKQIGHREISVVGLREMLMLFDKYPETKKLNDKVIKPCIDEINLHSDLNITYKPIKKGVQVVSYRFEIKLSNQINIETIINTEISNKLKEEAKINAIIQAESENARLSKTYYIYESIIYTFELFKDKLITLNPSQIRLLEKFKYDFEKNREIVFSSTKQESYLMGVLKKKKTLKTLTPEQQEEQSIREQRLEAIKNLDIDPDKHYLFGKKTGNKYYFKDGVIWGNNYERSSFDKLGSACNTIEPLKELVLSGYLEVMDL